MPNLIPSTPTLDLSAEAPVLPTAAVAPEDLPSLVQQRALLLLDVRSWWQRRHGHIPGSHSIPAGLLLAGEWPDGDLLLIGADTAQCQALTETMHDLGYNRQLRFLHGGYQAWVATTSQPGRSADVWSQSLGLLTLGVVVLLSPWMLKRSRA